VDRAQAFHKLYKDFGFTHAEIGRKMGKSREYVSNTLRLLSLSEEILQYLVEGRISEGHTRPLLMLVSKPEEQKVLVKEILLKKLTVRETESIARRIAQDRVTAKHKIDPEILSVERVLTEKFGTRVTIEPREVGGRLVISFFSAQDLQALLDSMRVTDERAMVPTVFAQNDQMVASTGDMRAPELVLAQELSDAMDAEPDDTLSEEFLPSVGPMEEDEAQVRSLDGLSEEEKQTPDTAPPPRESIFDAFIQSFTTPERTPTEDPFVNGMGVREAMPEVKPTIGVTPTPTRPMPEVLPKTPVAEDEKTDDDTDLYSVRNFSI
jgi:hypothetical protein